MDISKFFVVCYQTKIDWTIGISIHPSLKEAETEAELVRKSYRCQKEDITVLNLAENDDSILFTASSTDCKGLCLTGDRSFKASE